MSKMITYQGSLDTLVWVKEKKHLDINTEIIVPVAHEAVFVRDGKMFDSYTCGRYSLTSQATGEGHLFLSPTDTFDCKIFFVKKEGTYNIKFATESPVCFVDPVLSIPVEFDMSGVFAIKIIDCKRFLQKLMVFTRKINLEETKAFFRTLMKEHIATQLRVAMQQSKVSIIDLFRKPDIISAKLAFNLRYLFSEFGIMIEAFLIKKINLISGGQHCEQDICEPLMQATQPEKESNSVADGKGETMYCNKCGQALPPMSNFCYKCGEKIV
jgi:membrane protease subunit (stomatin/prohibitin family)